MNIENMAPHSGRFLKENGEVVNIANLLEGVVIKDSWEGNENITRQFEGFVAKQIVVSNDAGTDLTIVINGMRIKVKATEMFDDFFDDFTEVIIEATGQYRAIVKGR